MLAVIREYNPLLGSILSRAAVFHAIKRLVRSRGYYRLAFRDYVYVENFRVNGERIWSKKTMGFPALLSYALASIRGKLYPIESMQET